MGLDSRAPKPDTESMPTSNVLERVKKFLPSLQQANAQLAERLSEQPESLDIENVEEGAPHIEMDLACGVVDLKDQHAEAAALRAMHSGTAVSLGGCSPEDSSSNSSSSSDDKDDESNEIGTRQANAGEAAPVRQHDKEACSSKGHTDNDLPGHKAGRRAGIVELGT